jgi:DNA polymerase-2
MKGWLIDTYRAGNKVVLWIKTPEKNHRIEMEWKSVIYVDDSAKRFLKENNYSHKLIEKKNYLGENKKVYEIIIDEIMSFEKTITHLERKFKHRTMLYNADIAPEQAFLYHNKITPGQIIEIENNKICVYKEEHEISLTQCTIEFNLNNEKIHNLKINNHEFKGEEEIILKDFVNIFNKINPDIIIMDYAFSKLPLLDAILTKYNIPSPFHRWDNTPIKYKGNKSFYSYGRTILRDFAVRLKGRFLIDESSAIGHVCDVDAIMELCRLTGARFQQVASRSFGAVFQQSLIRQMYEQELLIPYKEKPVDIPITMLDMLRGDSGGHRFDPKVGYHENVAEIDFTSMYPWIIYNKNISADMMLTKKEPLEKVPGLPMKISHTHKGLIPLAIKPLLDKRMEYKKNPTTTNIKRAKGIKHVLVTAYGYARFREFKLGTASSHMAICAYAREIILETARIAEDKGFTVIHGVVDSLFLKKKNMTKEDITKLISELELEFGMPISYEGIFKWIVFLPSINDINRPLPSTYYGIFTNGTIKARGIELRQNGKPLLIRRYQKEVIELFSQCSNRKEMIAKIPLCAKKIREILINIDTFPKDWLTHKIILSKTEYKHNNVQKQTIKQLHKKGITPLAGQTIFYIIGNKGAILPEDYNGKPDLEYYEKRLERALFNIVQPFGITQETIKEYMGKERQTKLTENFHINNIIPPINSDTPINLLIS